MNLEPLVPSFRPDGSVFDLANVQQHDIVWTEIAGALSRIARFNGRCNGIGFSVAQHCVMGADALFVETGDAVLSGIFLLHDAEEGLTGDVTRPTMSLLGVYLSRTHGVAARAVNAAMSAAKADLHRAIHRRAGLPPLENLPDYARQVKDMDDRMLRAEAIALFGSQAAFHCPAADRPAPRLTGAIRAWAAMKAEEAWLERLNRYLGIEWRGA